jgi:large subunit ribosomal protein L4
METATAKKNTAKVTTQEGGGPRPASNGMEAKVYNQKGKEAGSVKLSEAVFGLPWNADLVHQVITSMESSAREGNAHTKTRGEVRGGGKKPWRQKGTGRARHGSIRSPLWKGGGVTHGPRNDKNYFRKVNRKMKAKALYTLLSRKYKDGEVLFIDSLSLKEPKTKEGKAILENLSGIKGFDMVLKKQKNSLLLALDKKNAPVEKSFRNFKNVELSEVRNLNPVTIANYRYLAIVNPSESLKSVSEKI